MNEAKVMSADFPVAARGSVAIGCARRNAGFTLLELMVALGLTSVIVLIVTRIGTDAQFLYESMQSRVEIYQKMRYALDELRDDLQGWVPIADLEYFVDRAQANRSLNGHWEEGEELDGPSRELNLAGGRPRFYDEGPQIQERYYTVDKGGAKSRHYAFSVYFRAPTEVEGELRSANIEYLLMDSKDLDAEGEKGAEAASRVGEELTDNTDLVLVKIVRYIDVDKSNFNTSELIVKVKRFDLCQNVTDFKIEYYADNPGDRHPGRYVIPSDERAGDVIESESPVIAIDGATDGYLKEFIYGGFRNLDVLGQFHKGERDAKRSLLDPPYFSVTGNRMHFAELASGDSIYLWTDDAGGIRGEFTLQRRVGQRLYFVESLDTSSWATEFVPRIKYKAAQVPSSLRVTLRVLNDKGREPRTVSVVVHPYNKHS
ncbi:MAG: PilW family protein [Planctomycetota bacterium]